MPYGKIIVIEGIDKAGKTTQSRLLMDALRSRGIVSDCLDFPDYSTPIGTEIKAFLDGKREYPDHAKLMLLSANRWEKRKDIRDMLESGTIVIMNRYYHSNLAYGISKNIELDWLQNLDKGMPIEDLCIVLDVSKGVSKSRSNNVFDLFESDDLLLERVQRNYRKLARRFKWRIVNANGSKEEVSKKIMKLVKANVKF